MFDISRAFETVASSFGRSAAQPEEDSLISAIEATGLDSTQRQGMGSEQLLLVLSDNGIDVANLAPDQLHELLSSSSLSELIPGITDAEGEGSLFEDTER